MRDLGAAAMLILLTPMLVVGGLAALVVEGVRLGWGIGLRLIARSLQEYP
jgi:hypothetical protein